MEDYEEAPTMRRLQVAAVARIIQSLVEGSYSHTNPIGPQSKHAPRVFPTKEERSGSHH